MADVVKPAVRSAMMSAIRGKDTQPEMVLRRGLFSRGFRYRLHVASLPGRPDIVIRKRRIAIQVHGCFWHAHKDCRFFQMPEGNRPFWADKLLGNRERDLRSAAALHAAGWRVAIVWECAVRAKYKEVLDLVCRFIDGDRQYVEIAEGGAGRRLKVRSKSFR